MSLNSIIVLRNINGYYLIHSTIIQLDKNHLTVNGEQMILVANMNITVEIKTDRRKMIDYVPNLLKTKTEENFLERQLLLNSSFKTKRTNSVTLYLEDKNYFLNQ